MSNGLEKVPQTLSVLLHPGQLTAVSGDLSQCGWNKKAKNIPLNIAAWTTQTDLIDIPLLSLLNSSATKSSLPPSVRAGWHARKRWLRRAQGILFSGLDVHPMINVKLEWAMSSRFTRRQVSLPTERGDWPPHDYEISTSSRKNSLLSSAPMHLLWLTRMKQKTSSMKTLNMLSQLFPLQTSSSFYVTLIQELDMTVPPVKEYWVNTGPENATPTAHCFFRPAPSIIF